MIDEVKKIVGSGKEVIGTNETMELLKDGEMDKVFLSLNAKDSSKKDFKRYCDMAGAELVQLEVPSSELGILCKKQFAVSVLGKRK